MIDETTGNNWDAQGTPSTPPPAGFCQDCGKPLTPETVRSVGNAVFCEPCLQTRLNPNAGASSVPPPPPPPYGTAPVPPTTSIPSPTVAGWLGLLPGAGAMYNGQYAKGFAHLIIFVVLANLGDHNSGFGALCFGWIIYMVFDAVATARAMRDGLPLPNPLHLNDIGDRIAHGWQHNQQQQAAHDAQAAAARAAAPTNPAAANWQPVPPAPAQANWAGYVPPTAFGGATPYQTATNNTQPGYVPPAYSQPGVDPNAAAAWQSHSFTEPVPAPRRFPVAAIVLIGLGVLFLLANVFPSIHISGSTTSALVLGVVAASLFYRRFTQAEQMRAATGYSSQPFMLHAMRAPILLATLSVMFLLQALDIKTIGQTWPIILIVAGVLAIADRMTNTAPAWPPTYPPTEPGSGLRTDTTATPAEEERP